MRPRDALVPLSKTAKDLATVSAQLSWPQRDQRLRGVFGTSSAAADQPAIGVFEAKVASASVQKHGSWVCELEPGAELSDADRRTLRARFAGQDVAFFAGPPALVVRHGATPAKTLSKPKKEALLAALQPRLDGVKDLVVRDGILQISVGPEFDRFSREPADAVFAATQKALGVDDEVPIHLHRLYASELATKGTTAPKDAYRGLRDGDT